MYWAAGCVCFRPGNAETPVDDAGAARRCADDRHLGRESELPHPIAVRQARERRPPLQSSITILSDRPRHDHQADRTVSV